MAKTDVTNDTLKAIAQTHVPEAERLILLAAGTFPNGTPPNATALYNTIHSMLALTKQHSWGISRILAGMDENVSIPLRSSEIRDVQIEESSQRAIVTYRSEVGNKSKEDSEYTESVRTERVDTPEGKRIVALAKSLIGQKATVYKYSLKVGDKKVNMLANLIPETHKTQTTNQASTQTATRTTTQPANTTETQETSAPATTETTPTSLAAHEVATPGELIAYGDQRGLERQDVIDLMNSVLGPVDSRPGSDTDNYSIIAAIIDHNHTNSAVYANSGEMAAALNAQGIENDAIKAASTSILPPPQKDENGKSIQRTTNQNTAIYLTATKSAATNTEDDGNF